MLNNILTQRFMLQELRRTLSVVPTAYGYVMGKGGTVRHWVVPEPGQLPAYRAWPAMYFGSYLALAFTNGKASTNLFPLECA
jgi:hypothetical protein